MFQSVGAAIGPAWRAGAPRTWSDLASAVRLAVRTQLTRQALPGLTDHLLCDIGISRAAAMAEAARLPWDLKAKHYR